MFTLYGLVAKTKKAKMFSRKWPKIFRFKFGDNIDQKMFTLYWLVAKKCFTICCISGKARAALKTLLYYLNDYFGE